MDDINKQTTNITTSKTPLLDIFQKLGDNAYCINSDCVFTNKNIIVDYKIYQVLDFLDKGRIKISYLQLLDAKLKDGHVMIMGIDMKTGEGVHKKICLNNTAIECESLIIELEYFDNEISGYVR